MFRNSPEILEGRLWTLTHAFYADMGGFVLTSPDYPLGFPINAEQLYYLVKHDHLDFPQLTLDRIKEKSKADTLSRSVHPVHPRSRVTSTRLQSPLCGSLSSCLLRACSEILSLRILVLWQVLWFSATEFNRIANGHPITTLELTALTFACVMVATSAVWYYKPSISNPETLETKDGRTVDFIRDYARYTVKPGSESFLT